ncbi:MAG: hypothetical protein ISN28_01440 [Ectothiorhodospiraceae bacterium AqS1]|nr:hypothetical protein [Ectothiorhodospiraceae bacterium AqS1]
MRGRRPDTLDHLGGIKYSHSAAVFQAEAPRIRRAAGRMRVQAIGIDDESEKALEKSPEESLDAGLLHPSPL